MLDIPIKQMILNMNKHIVDFLKYYFEMKVPPHYAILLKGDWGIGKTWFVKKTIKDRDDVIYVSLYGMTSIEQINSEIYKILHPVLTSSGINFAGKLLKGAFKATLKVDLDGNGTNETSIDFKLPDIGVSELLMKRKCIIFFDDLERTSIKISDVMGFVNHFVEHLGSKVILIANENEILTGVNCDNYKKTKEKIIGRTFTVTADFRGAFRYFSDDLQSASVKGVILKNEELIEKVYLASGVKNLRLLRGFIFDFERLFSSLSGSVLKKDDLINDLLSVYVFLFLEIKSNSIEINDVKDIKLSHLIFSETNQISKVMEKYRSLGFSDIILSADCWYDIFEHGVIDKDKIENSLISSKYFYNEKTPAWKKLWHFIELDESEFNTLIEDVDVSLEKMKFDNISVLQQVMGIFLKLSNHGLYNKSNLLEKVKRNVDYLEEKNLLPEVIRFSSGNYNVNNESSVDGLGIHCHDEKEFEELSVYIDDKLFDRLNENSKKLAGELLQLVYIDPESFHSRLVRGVPDSLHNIPILHYINEVDFVDAVVNSRPEKRKYISLVFSIRYKNIFNLSPEIDWLKKVASLLDVKVAENSLTAVQIKRGVLNEIKKAIESILG